MKFAGTADRRIHFAVQTAAAGAPTMLLVPGLGSGMNLFGTLPRRFARAGLNTITFDPVGIAPSTPLDGAYDFSEAANDLCSVLDAAGVSRCHVVGTSLGGKVALTFASQHPDRIGRLVLLASACQASPRGRRVYDYFRCLASQVDPQHFATLTLPFLFGHSFHARRPDLVADIARSMRGDTARVLMLAQAEALLTFDGSAAAEQLQCRTLCVVGDEDTLTSVEEVAATAALIPDAELLVTSEAGHSLLLEDPLLFGRIVVFLRFPWLGATAPE